MSYLAVENDRRIYFEHHRGDARPIVLIHGWGANTRCWDTTAPALKAEGHEVVLVDLRACGRSDKDFEDVSIAALADDVVKVVEHLGLESPVINGWSLGGAVATHVRVSNPLATHVLFPVYLGLLLWLGLYLRDARLRKLVPFRAAN